MPEACKGNGIALERVIPADVAAMWPHVEAWVRAATKRVASRWTAEQWRERCEACQAQLWVVRDRGPPRAAIITELYDTAAGKTCSLSVVGGRGLSCSLHVLDIIEEGARAQGCVRLEGIGRPGWERVLKDQGWTRVSVEIEKRLA